VKLNLVERERGREAREVYATGRGPETAAISPTTIAVNGRQRDRFKSLDEVGIASCSSFPRPNIGTMIPMPINGEIRMKHITPSSERPL
jgi:hypothetical protein